MPITGTQDALMECRSGVERCGSSRTGYYLPWTAITINGVDKTRSVDFDSLEVILNLNAEPNTARFDLVPGETSPTLGQTVIIGLGASDHRLFAGTIVKKTHTRKRAPDRVRVSVEVADWTRLLDRRIVTTYYAGESAGTIATSLITDFTSGFTTNGVTENLDTIDFFPCVLDTVSQALTRLASLIGGGWYIDANQDLHFFGAAGETGDHAPTPPVDITDSTTTLQRLVYRQDDTQRRNRILVLTKGARTTADVAIGQQAIPVEDASVFVNGGGYAVIPDYGAFQYGGRSTVVDGTTANGATAAGATSLPVTTLAAIAGIGLFPGWLLVGGRQYLYYTGGSAGNVTGIPASGAGSIQSDIADLEAVVNVPFLSSLVGGANALTRAIPAGAAITTLTYRNDTTAQTAAATVEGGDGIRDAVRNEPLFGVDNASAIGDAELDAFADALPVPEWDTYDLNAGPGRFQVFNLTGTDTISDTVMITRVTLHWVGPNTHPLRTCDGSRVRTVDDLDFQIGR
jgi:hypothetical protein